MNYFLYGPDAALLKDEVNNILKDCSKEERESAVTFDGQNKDVRVKDVLSALQMVSLFSMERNIVLWNNPRFLTKKSRAAKEDESEDAKGVEEAEEESAKGSDKEDLEMLKEYLTHSVETSELIIVHDKSVYPVDERSYASNKYVKLFKQYTRVVAQGVLRQDDFSSLVKKEIRQRKLEMEPAAVNELLDRLPSSVSLWRAEAEKLSLYPEKITADAVRHLISRTPEDKAYELTDAVLRKNLKRSLEVLEDLLNQKTEVVNLIGALATSFRNFFVAMNLEKKMSQDELAKVLGTSSGSVYHLLQKRRTQNPKQVLNYLDRLAKLDQKIKMGLIDPKTGLELFIIEACR